ncbi:hypothetical protein [Niabella beijingensis]|uniref:hypothetical protein n=1 Tax=Niabella beijingensis TaxID=2872700 RepID=UPI001CC1052A|nr:hypothetical protein [Niabella beijingensis]MBZ4192474.1 hypothetical protein [Niabella beijingensis]
MKSFIKLPYIITAGLLALGGCSKEKIKQEQEKPFTITEYFVAGTISPSGNSYKSIYLIQLLENNKAVFISSGKDFTGNYTLTDDSLVVIVSDPDNYREARFAVNSKHQLTAAQYKALAMEYNTTGTLLKIESTNQFAGKTFGGREYRMGPAVNKEHWYYKFDATGTKYGSGENTSFITPATAIEIINNSAFKFKKEATTELGFISGDSLTVFRYSGLYYFGNYKMQPSVTD